MMSPALDEAKRAAARAGVDRVHPGMRLALGTGSTAAFAIDYLAERFPGGTDLECVASSRAAEALAKARGLRVRPLSGDDRFDLMLDGADEVAPDGSLTKGGGGALFREKLLARLTRDVAILVDPSKLVERLGIRAPVPIEVVPFARPVVERTLRVRGWTVTRRGSRDGAAYVTDNGNEILDLEPFAPIGDPRRVEAELRAVPGVIETGLFVGLANRILIGHEDGRVEERALERGS